MSEELSYVLVTPHSIRKSRTGAILSRLISRTALDLVAARMFAPSQELADAFVASLVTSEDPAHRGIQELLRRYVLTNVAPSHGHNPRVLLLIFKGEDAVEKIRTAVGHILHGDPTGQTIRDTFGDYITDASGAVTYFEPAAIAPQCVESAKRDLQLWAAHSDKEGGILDSTIHFPTGAKVEKTLVLIKPDNFRVPSTRPGGVMDVFSRSGLYIVGFKVHRMSVAQAEQFYGPVLEVLMEKLKDHSGELAAKALESEFGLPISSDTREKLGELFGPIHGRENWEQIVKFMAGRKPSDCPEELRNAPGTEKCIALVYQGVDAVRKTREVLGPTDPSKAPPGSIRREFGQTIMVNAAHASDAAENAEREMAIIQIDENNFKTLVEEWYSR
ncbi:MAG: Nucleoside diphosphate kinase/Nucleoside diphosphate kinase [Verrucomicrobia bacterium]|nr:MAG: Nucleoside diphosphate kinase/Nucleoside diphosphate kinase [Verrucomicrobiota bacterium]